ncbi:hypothetical protein BDV96DRAFT_192859 [Lophiotrema nucula]|uniref:Secreted protein n=1 Tax=Lophiotrema nucula TaxID=690887 RepID=A0A6A5YUJ9_9PLEO|nr:hypothetical protein BDV96DRAFT_192859 [Lophiotrema nucula]
MVLAVMTSWTCFATTLFKTKATMVQTCGPLRSLVTIKVGHYLASQSAPTRRIQSTISLLCLRAFRSLAFGSSAACNLWADHTVWGSRCELKKHGQEIRRDFMKGASQGMYGRPPAQVDNFQ